MTFTRRRASHPPATQQRFAFVERAERLERRFKWAIAGFTIVAVCGLLGGMPTGRYAVKRLISLSRLAAKNAIGLPPDRAEVDADWKLKREQGVAQNGALYHEIYDEINPQMKRLLEYGGLDADHALLRWANYNRIGLLPSTVFLPDDRRSYRMRPHVRSIWLKSIDLPRGLLGAFLFPDTRELRKLVEGTGAYIVPGSSQYTNSWGLRGPEPDPKAPLRGLILGDSNAQGLFLGDDETPPACLERELARRLNTHVSLVNTGHLGYSPEQFYYSLEEYCDRFRPHFVVLSFCPNDLGDGTEVSQGGGDWYEARYWLERIGQFCRSRTILLVATAIPCEAQVTAVRQEGTYPGKVSNLGLWGSLTYCNPVEAFVDEHLRLRLEMLRKPGAHPSYSALFNEVIQDQHMSAKGAKLWGEVLGRRLALLLEHKEEAARNESERHTLTPADHAASGPQAALAPAVRP